MLSLKDRLQERSERVVINAEENDLNAQVVKKTMQDIAGEEVTLRNTELGVKAALPERGSEAKDAFAKEVPALVAANAAKTEQAKADAQAAADARAAELPQVTPQMVLSGAVATAQDAQDNSANPFDGKAPVKKAVTKAEK